MLPAKDDDPLTNTMCLEPGCQSRWTLSPFTLGGRGYCRNHAHRFLHDDYRQNVTPTVTPHLEKLADVLPQLKVLAIT